MDRFIIWLLLHNPNKIRIYCRIQARLHLFRKIVYVQDLNKILQFAYINFFLSLQAYKCLWNFLPAYCLFISCFCQQFPVLTGRKIIRCKELTSPKTTLKVTNTTLINVPHFVPVNVVFHLLFNKIQLYDSTVSRFCWIVFLLNILHHLLRCIPVLSGNRPN